MMTQVFLSYAEEDEGNMTKILNFLRRHGITTWTRKTDIQSGEDFQEAVKKGIEQADNIVYISSPHSQSSALCQMILDYAIDLKKRIIPILVSSSSIEGAFDKLKDLQYINWADPRYRDKT